MVRDDGAFRPPVAVTGDGVPSGSGTGTMYERAGALGGSLHLDAEAGTVVRTEAPLG